MKRSIGHKQFDIYTLSIGYHNDDDLINEYNETGKAETGLWAWCLLNEEKMFEGRNDNDLINQFYEMSKPSKGCSKNVCVFTFDLGSTLSFVLANLIKNYNLTYKAKFEDEDESVFNIICSESMSDVWSFKMKLHKGRSIIIFKDIEKILAGPKLKDLAKALKFDYTSILYDTHINRRVEGFEPSESDLNCIRQKAELLLEVVEYHKDDKYFFKASSAASYSIKRAIDYAYGNKLKPYTEFRKEYPELEREEHDFVCKTVEGGLSFVNKFYQGKEQEHIYHSDRHNQYPGTFQHHKMPYGKGVHIKKSFDIDENFDGELFPGCYAACKCIVSCQFQLCPFRRSLGSDLMYVPVFCWDFELPYLFKCYNYVEVEVVECYVYKTKFSKFSGYFVNNYKQRIKERTKGNDYGVMYFKLLNNSFYGKVGERTYDTEIIPSVDSLGNLYTIKNQKEEFNLISTYTYEPMFSCISALARCEMYKAIFEIGLAHVYYVATDSIFSDMDLSTMQFWKRQDHRDWIGCWDDGEILEKAEFVGDKRYKCLDSKGNTIIHNAGFTYENGETYKNVNLFEDTRQVNTKVRVPGGTLIVPITKAFKSEEEFMNETIKSALNHEYYVKHKEITNEATDHIRYLKDKGFLQYEGVDTNEN